MSIQFLVQGSSDDPYRVTFEVRDGQLKGYCTCPAGDNGQFCKHRINLLYGVVDNVLDLDEQKMALLHSWIPGSEVETALQEIIEAEKEVARANKVLKEAKKNLSKVLR